MPVLTLIIYIAQEAIYYIGGTGIINFYNHLETELHITIGQISAATTYITMICNALINLGMIFTNMGRAMISVGRVNEILNYEVTILDGEKETLLAEEIKGVIEYSNVCFSYPKSKSMVLDDISFKINQGETIAIVGATGCGKSTLVNLMIRMYDTTSGSVLIDGVDVKDYKLVELRDKISLVLQKSELFNVSIKENILWGNQDATMEEVEYAAKIAQADTFINGFVDKYDTYVAEKGASLSGGQKQRISIARALIKKPEILVFDDSTSALDLQTEAKLYQAINNDLKDLTIITIAQRVASVKNADKIIVFNDGTITDIGTHEELIKNSPTYIDIYNSQLKKEGDE
jgi:ATP-binding cassette subfamily B protein